MNRSALDRLFRPKSVALIGASTDPKKIGGRPLHFLKKHGFTGDIWPVNPNAEEIDGLPCFTDIASLPGTPDLAIVLLGPRHVEQALKDLALRKTGAAIVLAGGFAETGEGGATRQQALIEAADGMRVLGPNTIGLLNMTDGITLSASGALDVEDRFAGGVAVVSQSGGILGSLLSRASAQGTGLSLMAATGNEADIDVGDLMSFLAQDDATKVVALYLETIRHPDRFRKAAADLADAGKRLVVYKVGRSEAGAQSAASHTGAMAGEDRVFDALFRQTGAIRVDCYSDLIDVPTALAAVPPMDGNRIAILSTTGGAAGLVADVCGVAGFETPPPSAETTARLAALFEDDGFMPDRNPVDLTLAGLHPDIFHQAILVLAESGDYDAVIPIAGSSSVGRPRIVADPIIQAASNIGVPMIVYTSPSAPAIVQRLNAAGVPTYPSPEACAAALSALRRPAFSTAKETGKPVQGSNPFSATSGPLNEAEAKRLFAAWGIDGVKETAIENPEAASAAIAELGGTSVVKILSRGLLHKTEIGGVRLNVPSEDAADTCIDITASAAKAGIFEAEGFLIQEQIYGAVEMIVGYRNDPALGPAVLIGAGGAATELYDDAVVCLIPAAGPDIRTALASLAMYPMLSGYRGQIVADIDRLVETILNFSDMCLSLGDRLIECEINPLFIGPEDLIRAGDGVVVFRG